MSGQTPGYAPHNMLDALSSRYVDLDEIPWQSPRPGMRVKMLYKNVEEREALVMIETDPGYVIEEHQHTGLEYTFVMEGSMVDHQGTCSAGNFVWRPEGSQHQVTTPDGAKMLTFFKGGAKNVASGMIFPDFGTASAAKEAAE